MLYKYASEKCDQIKKTFLKANSIFGVLIFISHSIEPKTAMILIQILYFILICFHTGVLHG